jgi:hypothetical protein
MTHHFTHEEGHYASVPVLMPLSLEMHVAHGEKVKGAYTAFREHLEQQPNYTDDAYYNAMYSYLKCKQIRKVKQNQQTQRDDGKIVKR